MTKQYSIVLDPPLIEKLKELHKDLNLSLFLRELIKDYIDKRTLPKNSIDLNNPHIAFLPDDLKLVYEENKLKSEEAYNKWYVERQKALDNSTDLDLEKLRVEYRRLIDGGYKRDSPEVTNIKNKLIELDK